MFGTLTRLKEDNYCNWLKLHRSKHVFHDFLLRFVRFQAKRSWNDVATTWIKSQALCDSCSSRDVTYNPRRVPKSKCWALTCARNVCGRWVAEVARIHAQTTTGGIAFTNSDIKEWPLDWWAFAKVFMASFPIQNNTDTNNNNNNDSSMKQNQSATARFLNLQSNKDDVISTNHLLSYVINCSNMHAAVRRSRDQNGGVSARHLVKIKQVSQMIAKFSELKF